MSYIKKEFTFRSVSGLADIHCASYVPENGEVKAVLQVAHGMAEHGERYEEFAGYLCSKGFAVLVDDHIGHGKSVKTEDVLGYFGEEMGWDAFVEDERTLTELICKELVHNSIAIHICRTHRDRRDIDLDWELRLRAYIGNTKRDVEVCRSEEATYALALAVNTVCKL